LRASPLACALACTLLARAAFADVIHIYTRGETFAAIAERYYGNPALEPVVVANNCLQLQATPGLPTGVHLTIPSVGYHRVAAGETWERLATRHLGDPSRGPYLARINGGVFNVPPSEGAVIRLPYLLRYVVNSEEPMFEVARRFYGDRALVQFISEFNHLASQRLLRGQMLILPLADLVLRETAPDSPEAALITAHTAQRQVDRELPTLQQLVTRGLYVEAVALGARLLAHDDLASPQRVVALRNLAEAYAALDRRDLAADAFRDLLRLDPTYSPEPSATPPKVLEALSLARGTAPEQSLRPAPPTARPDSAH
jgi:tetratricopeptide (TPR) repeat protein